MFQLDWNSVDQRKKTLNQQRTMKQISRAKNKNKMKSRSLTLGAYFLVALSRLLTYMTAVTSTKTYHCICIVLYCIFQQIFNSEKYRFNGLSFWDKAI